MSQYRRVKALLGARSQQQQVPPDCLVFILEGAYQTFTLWCSLFAIILYSRKQFGPMMADRKTQANGSVGEATNRPGKNLTPWIAKCRARGPFTEMVQETGQQAVRDWLRSFDIKGIIHTTIAWGLGRRQSKK